ncbi:MAG: hypothetical protein KY444_02650, partial [Gemmatimonadetes bacterium]|nr:hypothetical protein [Gemmatimonadota bacterium]
RGAPGWQDRVRREGHRTSRALVAAYLARIEAYDRRGPYLNTLITVNLARWRWRIRWTGTSGGRAGWSGRCTAFR